MNRLIAFSTALTIACAASAASAAPAFTEEQAQVSGHLAYGFSMDDDDGEVDPYGFGFGARGGYTFEPGIYVGGLFDYFLGETEDTSVTVPFVGTAEAEVSANLWLLQGEVGYDIGVSDTIVIRPKIGLGMAQIMAESCASVPLVGEECDDDTNGEFAFQIGVEAPIDLGGLFVAPEMRFNIVDDASGFILGVGAGAAF